ncbi:DUF1223 domain-containing protein [Pontixanthobacter sp.]|uniref:DUF1223 domain-containing protein n=1 Tax=Pontixanthobacter sp. TaxID=2792078 RepID=UPI003C7BD7D7
MKTTIIFAGLGLAAVTFFAVNPLGQTTQRGPLTATGKAAPLATAKAPVVLELFTSQGCSSCPPADRLAAQLASDPALLVITRPVTYWDRLGWTDTLARAANTDLQRAYARRGNEGAGVYTPQIIVNGRHGAVGSNARSVSALARDAAMKTRPVLAVTATGSGGYSVRVSGAVPGASELMLVALSSHETVAIGRGENGGRSVSYTNVVRSETRIPASAQARRAFTITADQLDVAGADTYAIILRKPAAGAILAGTVLG